MRQLTLASACWAKALGAWPALTWVATQVVRIVLFQAGSWATRASTSAGGRFGPPIARRSAASGSGVSEAMAVK